MGVITRAPNNVQPSYNRSINQSCAQKLTRELQILVNVTNQEQIGFQAALGCRDFTLLHDYDTQKAVN